MLRRVVVATLLWVGVSSIADIGSAGGLPARGVPTASVPSRFVPVGPLRLADTRGTRGFKRLDAHTIRVPVTARVDATAAVLTVTATETRLPAFVTVWAAGTPRPTASNANVTGLGQTLAATAATSLGLAGAVDIYASSPLDLVVDVTGLFVVADGPVSAGRYTALTPARLLDTRSNGGRRLVAGQALHVPLPADVPPGASAVAVNLTVTASAAPGYFTMWPAGAARPLASSGNVDRADQTRATFAVIPVSADGLQVFTQTGAHVVLDISGYFTGDDSPPATEGEFISAPIKRVLDSRDRLEPLYPGGGLDIPADPDTQALWINVTSVGARSASYLTAWPAATARPIVSTVNAAVADDVVANAAITPVSSKGVGLYSLSGEDAVVDVAGRFTGPAMQSTNGGEVNELPMGTQASRTIGASVEGRPIVARHMKGSASAARRVLVIGTMHGEEPAGLLVTTALQAQAAQVPTDLDLWIIETVNPDGLAVGERSNARGVDLNRNFDGGSSPWCATPGCGPDVAENTGTGPLSEPESRAVWRFLQLLQPDVLVVYHQPLDSVDCAPKRGPQLLAMCSAYAAATMAEPNVTFLDESGTLTNSYMQMYPGKWAFTVEFGYDQPSPAMVDASVLAVFAL